MALWMETSHLYQDLTLVGVHGSFIGRDILYLICHKISNDHHIMGSRKYIGESSLWYVITLISLVAINIVIVEI